MARQISNGRNDNPYGNRGVPTEPRPVDATGSRQIGKSEENLGRKVESDIARTGGTRPSAPLDPSLQMRNQWQGMRDAANRGYKEKTFGYNPYMTETGGKMGGMDFNPYRSAAVNASQSQAGQGLVSQQSLLQQQGGLSASDRMRNIGSFNRQKIMGQLGANQQFDQAQSQNQLDVSRYNSGRQFDVNRSNIMATNDASRDLAQANLRRDTNLYEGALGERNLNRQLEASRIISAAQMKGNGESKSAVDKLLSGYFESHPLFSGGIF